MLSKHLNLWLVTLAVCYALLFLLASGIFTKARSADVEGAIPARPTYTCDFVKVLDGDTAKVFCSDWPEPFATTSLRVYGIDTPESSRRNAKCAKELKMGLAAKAWAKREFDGAKTVGFVWAGTVDKYGGRLDAYVTLPSGKDWATEAVRVGFARPYGLNGSLTKSDWCH